MWSILAIHTHPHVIGPEGGHHHSLHVHHCRKVDALTWESTTCLHLYTGHQPAEVFGGLVALDHDHELVSLAQLAWRHLNHQR